MDIKVPIVNAFIDGDMAYMEQLAPRMIDVPQEVENIAQSLGMKPSTFSSDSPPMIVNTGNAFLIVPLRRALGLADLKPNIDAIGALSKKHDLIGYYVFSPETTRSGRDAGTRMFAPRYGINEESATGMAAGPLACYLRDQMGMAKEIYSIEQGHFMNPPSPSLINVKLVVEGGLIRGLMAGGRARVMSTKLITVK